MTKPELANRLHWLADEMIEIAVLMDYYGGMAEWAKHGKELTNAAFIARQWADEIREEE